MNVLIFSIVILLIQCNPAASHGRLIQPPGRSSMWRYGFNTPVNYDDNQLYCGGRDHQMMLGGKCGLCGDPWDGERRNEAGGKFATGTIAKCYEAGLHGGQMEVKVELTAHHKGYFEFRLCVNNNVKRPITQECLDQHLLKIYGTGRTKYDIGDSQDPIYTIQLEVPSYIICSQCVLQWKYHAGNNWGCDSPGNCGPGKGPQEEFYGCSDIEIAQTCNGNTGTNVLPRPQPPPPPPPPMPEPVPSGSKCCAIGIYATNNAMHEWCIDNCARGFCPASHCTCNGCGGSQSPSYNPRWSNYPSSFYSPRRSRREAHFEVSECCAVGGHAGNKAFDKWCVDNCARKFCPPTFCKCNGCDDAASGPTCCAVGVYATMNGMDNYCITNCAQGFCPASHCTCDGCDSVTVDM